MTTLVLAGNDALQSAAQVLRSGGLVAIPTETVYGLAANAFDSAACTRIFEAKGRPQDNPLIVHISDISMVNEVASEVSPAAKQLMDAFWPGPLSIVLPKSARIPDAVSAGLTTVAVRMPSSETARKIISAAGVPLAAPSANRSGQPSPTCAEHVLHDMNGRIPLIVDGGPCTVGVESTVIDCTEDVPALLRPGDIGADEIRDICGAVRHAGAHETDAVPRSPGMKYAHYAPKAAVHVVRGRGKTIANKVQNLYYTHKANGGRPIILCGERDTVCYPGLQVRGLGRGAQDAQKLLFRELRAADERGEDLIVFQYTDDMGPAVLDRITRAACAARMRQD